MTGAAVTVTEVPFAEIFQKTLTDWATGTNSIDVAVLAASWVPELVDGGLIEDLSPHIAKDDKINVADIAPFFREYNQKVAGKTYTITIDGDFQMAYYRKDILDKMGLKPPRTWDEVRI